MKKVTKEQVKKFVIENCTGSVMNLDAGDVASLFDDEQEIHYFMFEEPKGVVSGDSRLLKLIAPDEEALFAQLEEARRVLFFIQATSEDEYCLTMEDVNGMNDILCHCVLDDVETKWGLDISEDCPYNLRLHCFIGV